ncbi:MAG: alkaline phosphatase [Treponema sp.]|nr:alkaline phosphatase [Treponema sp.]
MMYLKRQATGKLLLLLILYLFLITGCASNKSAAPAEEELLYYPVRHLVFIGIDGWGGAYTSKAKMPAAKQMMAEGASSMKMKCIMPSNSWENWLAFFNGTPPEQINSDQFPSIFTIVNENYPASKPVFFFEWSDLDEICSSETAEKIRILSDIESAQKVASYIIENKPVFTAVVFNEPDETGHRDRWGSKAYYDKLTELDGLIAIIKQAVIDAGIYENTVFVLSSDHGGTFWGHGFNITKQRQIPLIIYGKGIKQGVNIPKPGLIYNIAPTMAAILDLEVPPEWTGQTLWSVFK